MMLPQGFVERIKSQRYIDANQLTEALALTSPVSVRINPEKWSVSGLSYEKVPWEPSGFYLDKRPQYTLDPLFHAGVYYPQEASSMFTGEAFRQLSAGMKDIRVLDLCGAPGGKSTHLASLLGDNGFLIANEVIRSRASVLAENIAKWGTGNVAVTQNDPSDFKHLEHFFDFMVVDAPCSGEGMFRDAVAIGEWSPANARLCSERQRRILIDAWPSLKPGGILIYSTCTFNPAENEENVLWLHNITGAEPVALSLRPQWGIKEIYCHGVTGYAFHPGEIRGDGFFISALRKPSAGRFISSRIKPVRLNLPRDLSVTISGLVSFSDDRLFCIGAKIVALAMGRDIFNYLSERLNIIKAGTVLGEFKNGTFIPEHDLAMSVKIRSDTWPCFQASYDDAVSFLRIENIKVHDMPYGRMLVCYRGIPLGFINSVAGRINNGYPRSWRIRIPRSESFSDILY